MNKLKPSKKDLAFEELIKELRPLLRQSKELNYGSGGTHGTNQFKNEEKELSEYTLRFDYKGFTLKVELK